MTELPSKLLVYPLVLLVVLLAGCGFRLAGTAEMPENLSQIQLNTTGFSAAQREALVSRLEQAGSVIVTGEQPELPTLAVTLGKLVEYSLFETAQREQTKRLIQQMSYRVLASDGRELLAERRLRQESSFELDLFNVAGSERQRDQLQEQMQNVLTSRMIYQLQQL